MLGQLSPENGMLQSSIVTNQYDKGRSGGTVCGSIGIGSIGIGNGIGNSISIGISIGINIR